MLSPAWSTKPSWLLPFSRESCFDNAACCCCLVGLLFGASIQSLSRSSGLMKAAQHTHTHTVSPKMTARPMLRSHHRGDPPFPFLTVSITSQLQQRKGRPPSRPETPNAVENSDSKGLEAGERYKHALYLTETPHGPHNCKLSCAIFSLCSM